MAPQSSSVFLNIPPSAYIAQNALAFAVRDRYPVSPGHALVIPFRAVETWFDASPEEQAALFALVDVVKAQLDQGVLCADGARRVPDGYNVGFNAGLAAGQTVMHLHVHVIPRFTGDMDDPRGGVRHVIPSKGNYLSPPDRSPHDHSPPPPALLTTGGARSPLLDKLQPLFAQADDIDILVAFVRRSGLACIQDEILSATARGARVRLLTGDYLGITDPDALGALFDLSAVALTPAEHGGEDGADDGADEDIPPAAGSLTARIIETATARPSGLRVFHPKAWRFENPTRGVAFVGSSNLSASALKTGIEWNLGLERSKEPQTFSALRAAFDDLWGQATPLSAAWIDGYRRRRVVIPTRLKATAPAAADAADAADAAVAAVAADAVSFGAEGANDSEDSEDSEDSDELPPLPPPHLVQQEALVALAEARASGRTRALVVLATGLGKTLLAALDYAQMARSLNRLPKLLFIAHRRELLLQAASCYRRLSPSQDPAPRIGWCMEESADLSADAIFASVAKLAQPRVIARLQALCFDYVVIDEVHHAAAPSYQRILAALDARFVLGLTATPERADDRDVFGIFDDFVAYRADIPRGIDLNFLVPFAYHGLKDDIDYAQIPWRNRRFDPEALARAAQTEARMQTLLKAWRAHPGARTVVFCCSVAHAKFTKQWLRAHDIRALAIFSGPDSDDRDAALEELRAGHIDALCAVDLLNEGIDVRALDRVVMLRPTESNVVFLQQLGRGLRACEGKRLLTVIDFVGNHRLFLDRLRALLSLTAQSSPPAAQLRALLRADDPSDADDAAHRDDAPLALPPGCSVELALEAKHQLNKLFHKRADAADVVTSAYQEARLVRGERPTAGELLRSGYDPSSVSKAHDGWFLFVAAQGDLTPEAAAVATAHAPWLLDLEQADMTKSFKMILLEALLALGGVSQPVALDALAVSSWRLLERSAALLAEVPEAHRPDGSAKGAARWRAYWRKNPVEAWTAPKKARPALMRLDGDMIRLNDAVTEAQAPLLEAFLRELVDYKLTRYRRRGAQQTGEAILLCRVIHSGGGDPIIKLPDRSQLAVPEGEQPARLPDGSTWVFRFAKEFCNVARPPTASRNQLPDLLRRWFGPTAGASGTRFEVRFTPSPDGLWVEPVSLAQVIPLRPTAQRSALIPTYPDLRAAAGHAQPSAALQAAERVAFPGVAADPDCFAARVEGDSMDGGASPLRHGDWAVWRLARGAASSALEGRVVLVESSSPGEDRRYQIKRLLRDEAGWRFSSDNPRGPSFLADTSMQVIARLERALPPEALAPAVGATISTADLPQAFGLDALPPVTGRAGGQVFLFIQAPGALRTYTSATIPQELPPLRPAESAFILAKSRENTWTYLGVGRPDGDNPPRLTIPEVDFETWRAWGHGRSASRTPPEGSLERARLLFDAALALPEAARVINNPSGNRAFIRARAGDGLLIDGGPGGFQPRRISLTDLAWVIVAADDATLLTAPLDEARVNRARYLAGTPRPSTRYIDTGWAIGIYRLTAQEPAL